MSLHDLLKSIDLPKLISVLQLLHVITSTDLLKTVTSLESTDVMKLANLLQNIDFNALTSLVQTEETNNEETNNEEMSYEEMISGPVQKDTNDVIYAKCRTF